MVKKKEINTMGKEELEKQLKELRMEVMKANSQVASGSAKNPGQIKLFKKNIARILTLLKTKEAGKKDE